MEDKIMGFEELVEIIKKVRPEWEMNRASGCHSRSGEGFVDESIFTFFKHHYLWITFLCEPNTFAYKVICPEWVGAYSQLILKSPLIFVEYDKHHRICGWSAGQEKHCPGRKK